MFLLDPSLIRDWHAHIYFDEQSRETAWVLREAIAEKLGNHVQIGHFHQRLVGPHPMWSYLIFFDASAFTHVIGWLTLNRSALDVLVHPNTGSELRDHRDSAIWLGNSHALDLTGLAE